MNEISAIKKRIMIRACCIAFGRQATRQLIETEEYLAHDSGAVAQASLELERAIGLGIKVFSILDSEYPALLRQAVDPPLILFVKGLLPQKPCISVVGSRAADIASFRFASKLSREIALSGGLVVSGLARGVDGAAHGGAIESGSYGSTVAVLAHGLDRVYPISHEALAESIVTTGGALVSEYPCGVAPLKHHFLERNRIVAAYAPATVVVQAGERSGALVTAREVLDAGRDLFVVPGAVDHQGYFGSHRLLKTGAYLLTSIDDLAEYLPQAATKGGVQQTELARIFENQRSVSIDFLVQNLGLSRGEVMKLVTELELKGLVEQIPGGQIDWLGTIS